jgi:alkylation response protein AidB-like acyl-CoA dehydrogenase
MNEVRKLIVQTAADLFRNKCTPEVIRKAESGIWPEELWKGVVATGLTLASIPEEYGGVGGTIGDALAVLRVTGQFSVPLPIAESFLSGWLLSTVGLTIPEGLVTLAYPLHLEKPEPYTISGTVSGVPWARFAGNILTVIVMDNRLFLTLVKPDEVKIVPGINLAGEPHDAITFSDIPVEHLIPLNINLDWIRKRAALARSALMVGALETLLEMTVKYAGERVQFGRTLNNFQAIQQQLALLAGEVTSTRISMEAAALDPDNVVTIAAAKIRAGEAAGQASAIAHQIHGAMGYTYEYPMQLFTRRLLAWRDEAGSESEWAIILGNKICRAGADSIWAILSE